MNFSISVAVGALWGQRSVSVEVTHLWELVLVQRSNRRGEEVQVPGKTEGFMTASGDVARLGAWAHAVGDLWLQSL